MPFATSYLAVRTLLLVLVARTRGWFANPFSVAVFVAAPLRPAGTALGALCLLVVVVVAVHVWEYAAGRRG